MKTSTAATLFLLALAGSLAGAVLYPVAGRHRAPAPPASIAPEPPPPPGTVPIECVPYEEEKAREPKSVRLTRAQVLKEMGDWKGEPHPDRQTCWNYGRTPRTCSVLEGDDRKDCEYHKTHDFVMCDSWVQSNAMYFADRHLYPFVLGTRQRACFGGGVECKSPVTADTVRCVVEINDTTYPFDTVAEVDIDCSSELCAEDQDCCKVVRRRKVFKKAFEPTEAEMLKLHGELAHNRARRYLMCKKWCEDPLYAGKCSSYWDNGKTDLERERAGLPPRDL